LSVLASRTPRWRFTSCRKRGRSALAPYSADKVAIWTTGCGRNGEARSALNTSVGSQATGLADTTKTLRTSASPERRRRAGADEAAHLAPHIAETVGEVAREGVGISGAEPPPLVADRHLALPADAAQLTVNRRGTTSKSASTSIRFQTPVEPRAIFRRATI
jgi:hypothetical protein